MKSFVKAVFILTIFSTITRFMGFIFHIYLSRELGAEMLGLYQVASSFIGILMTIVCSGIPLTTAKLTSKYIYLGDVKRKHKVGGSAMVIALGLSVVLCAIVYLARGLFNHIFADQRCVEIMILMLPAVIYSSAYCVFRGVMWGENRFFSVSITELFEQIVRIVLTVVLIKTLADHSQATLAVSRAFSIACLSSAVLAGVLFFKFKNKLNFNKGEYVNVLTSSSAITGIRLTSSLTAPIASVIVPAQLIASGLTSSQALSLYGVMMGMTTPLLYVPMSFIGSLGMALVPNLAGNLAKGNYASIRTSLKKCFAVVLYLSIMFIPVFLAVGKSITSWLYHDQMAGLLLQQSAILVLPIAIMGMSNSILNGMSLEKKSFWNYLIGSAILLVVLLVCTRSLGIQAVILATGLSTGTISVLNIRLLYKNVPELNLGLLRDLGKYAIVCLPTTLLGVWLHNLLCLIMHSLISAILCSLVMVVLYTLLACVIGLFSLEQLHIRRKEMKKAV